VKKLVIAGIAVVALAASATAGALVTRIVSVAPGDIVSVRGTRVICTVVNKKPNPTFVTCYKAAANGGPRPTSYGVAVSMSGIVVSQYRTQKQFKTVFQRRH